MYIETRELHNHITYQEIHSYLNIVLAWAKTKGATCYEKNVRGEGFRFNTDKFNNEPHILNKGILKYSGEDLLDSFSWKNRKYYVETCNGEIKPIEEIPDLYIPYTFKKEKGITNNLEPVLVFHDQMLNDAYHGKYLDWIAANLNGDIVGGRFPEPIYTDLGWQYPHQETNGIREKEPRQIIKIDSQLIYNPARDESSLLYGGYTSTLTTLFYSTYSRN